MNRKLGSVATALVLAFLLVPTATLYTHNDGLEVKNDISINPQYVGPALPTQISYPQPRNPAPMGIADYGVDSNGYYEYTTQSFVGLITLNSLSTLGDSSTTIQLNVFFCFTAQGSNHTYWIQNIAGVWPSHKQINFGSYIFNFSGGKISDQGLIGSGQALPQNSYYSCYNSSCLGQNAQLVYPATVMLNLTSGFTSTNQPFVDFCYDDGYGLVTYDHVIFNVMGASSCGFKVRGTSTGMFYYNSELVFCGAGSLVPTVTFAQSDVRLRLEYWNGHNYQMVTNAYNFGSVTSESAANVSSRTSYHADNGTVFADVRAGNGSQGVLYTENTTGTINMKAPSSGALYVVNATSGKSECKYDFLDGEVTINIYPGYYNLRLFQDGLYFDQGNFTISGGQKLSFQAQTDTPTIPEFPSLIMLAMTVLLASAVAGFRKRGVNWQ